MSSGMDKSKPIFGLKKLPVELLLKSSQQEVGKLKAYVDELEYDKKQLLEQVAEVSKENARLADKCCELEAKLNQLKQVLQL